MTKLDYELLYGNLHREKPKLLSGQSIVRERRAITRLLEEMDEADPRRSPRLLDYGSGKGHQYLVNRIHEEWGVRLPYCYDIGIAGLRAKPEGKFDGVICNDVLEHIHEEDLDEILDEIFGYVYPDRVCFVYLGIDTRPARKVFVGSKTEWDGQQVHMTLKPKEWWEDKLAKYRRDNLILQVACYDE